jgi:hypothetical protein
MANLDKTEQFLDHWIACNVSYVPQSELEKKQLVRECLRAAYSQGITFNELRSTSFALTKGDSLRTYIFRKLQKVPSKKKSISACLRK